MQTPSIASPVTPKKESIFLLCLAGIQFTHILDFMVMMPLGPMLMRTLGIDTGHFGMLVSAYALSAAVSGLAAASVVDRFERRRLLLTLYLLFAAATLVCAVATSYPLLLLGRALAGAFGGVLGAMIQTFIGECIPEERRGRAVGTVMGAFAVSTIAGVPLGLYLANHFGWSAPFFFVAGLSLVIALFSRNQLPRIPPRAQAAASPLATMLAVFKEPAHLRALAFMSAVIVSGFLIIPYISIYLTANVGLPERDLWLIYLAGGAATLISSRAIGVWADKSGKVKVYRWVAFAAMAPMLITTHLVPGPMWLILLNATLFFVLVSGRMVPGMALVTSSAAPQMRGAFMSVVAATQQLASGLASFLAGIMVSKAPGGQMLGYRGVGYLAVAVGVAAIWWVGRLGVGAERQEEWKQ